MEILPAIYEASNDDLVKSLPRLPSVHGTRFGPAAAHMFGAVLARRGGNKDKSLDLHHCGVNDELIDIMVQNLKGLRLQVSLKDP